MHALRVRQMQTVYGAVPLDTRPVLFAATWTALAITAPVLLGVLVLEARAPHMQLFQWIWPR